MKNTKRLLVGITLAASVSLLAGAQAISLLASNWTVLSDSLSFFGTGRWPLVNVAGVLEIEIPTYNADQQMVSYLYTTKGVPRSVVGLTLEVTGRLDYTGSPVWGDYAQQGNECPNGDGRIHPFFSTTTDIWNSSTNNWWYASFGLSFDLRAMRDAGSGTTILLAVPISPESWTNLYGQPGTSVPAQWKKAIGSVKMMGLTFGCGYFDGHGLAQSGGTARFDILAYTVK